MLGCVGGVARTEQEVLQSRRGPDTVRACAGVDPQRLESNMSQPLLSTACGLWFDIDCVGMIPGCVTVTPTMSRQSYEVRLTT